MTPYERAWHYIRSRGLTGRKSLALLALAELGGQASVGQMAGCLGMDAGKPSTVNGRVYALRRALSVMQCDHGLVEPVAEGPVWVEVWRLNEVHLVPDTVPDEWLRGDS